MMKIGIKVIMLVVGLSCASMVSWAIPMPDFIFYGKVNGNSSASAYWNDKKIAKAEKVNGYFRMAIPMDTKSEWKTGDIIELWLNGAPTGRTAVIGKMGEAHKLKF